MARLSGSISWRLILLEHSTASPRFVRSRIQLLKLSYRKRWLPGTYHDRHDTLDGFLETHDHRFAPCALGCYHAWGSRSLCCRCRPNFSRRARAGHVKIAVQGTVVLVLTDAATPETHKTMRYTSYRAASRLLGFGPQISLPSSWRRRQGVHSGAAEGQEIVYFL
jgi:hypothetical protein